MSFALLSLVVSKSLRNKMAQQAVPEPRSSLHTKYGTAQSTYAGRQLSWTSLIFLESYRVLPRPYYYLQEGARQASLQIPDSVTSGEGAAHWTCLSRKSTIQVF